MLHLLQYKTLSIRLRCRYLSFVIPLCSILVLLLFNSNTCFAIDPSASLTISTPSLSATGKTGEVINVSTDIKVDVKNAESYSLILSVDDLNMTNGNTTLTPGNVVDPNTWGYKWDDATTYTAPTAEGAELAVPSLESNAINFTKTLTFGAKFDPTANAGHYKASGTLSLVATPKQIATDISEISTMQEMNAEICNNIPLISDKPYSEQYPLTDNRIYPEGISKTYTIRKFADGGTGGNSGKCWMTENLRIYDATLTSADSDIETESFSLTSTTDKGLFTDNDIGKYTTLVYRGTSSDPTVSAKTTTYYNWFAATAGAGNSSVATNNQSVDTSICPKGWTLPTGNSNKSTSDFGKFAAAAGIDNDITGSTTIRDNIYSFKYTGRIDTGSLIGGTVYSYWWSNTVASTSNAYNLYVDGSNVGPGTNNNRRYYGFAIRCIARNS